MHLDKAIGLFENYLFCERYLSRNSCIEYVRDVKQFSIFALKNNAFEVSKINQDLIIKFRLDLLTKKITMRSHARKITSLRQFFKFLKIRYDFEEILLTPPKFDYKLPEYFNKIDIFKILNHLEHDKTVIGKRNKLVFKLFYATGIRVSELSNIKLEDFKFDERLLLVKGKGNKERYIPIPKIINKDIQRFIRTSRNKLLDKKNCDYLFFGNCLKSFSRQGLWSIMNKIGKKLNVKLFPHKIRHSFATHLLENGGNLRAIQKLLGHETIINTEIYTHLDKTHLRKFYNKFHPRS